MNISPLLIAAIVIGLLVVVVVVILLAGGAAWFVLRKKPKPPAKHKASAVVKPHPQAQTPVQTPMQTPVRTPPRSPADRLAVEPQKPAIGPAAQPAGPIKPPLPQPEAAKRAPQTVIECVDKEQERVAQEMSGAAKNWKMLFADAFNHGTQASAGAAGEISSLQNISPDAQILVETLDNTAKDVSNGMATAGLAAGLRQAGGLTGPAGGSPLARGFDNAKEILSGGSQ